jgi:F-type H+-transporting ATPase subunit a
LSNSSNSENTTSFGDIVLHHVTNDSNHVYYPFHVFGIDLSITKHIIMLWIVCGFIIALALWGTRKYRKNINATPEGLSSLFEIFIDFIKKDIIDPNIGGKEGKVWLPLITTFFLFILSANLLGMIPIFEFIKGGSATITGNFSVTLALAVITFFSIIIAGTIKHGFFQYWKNMVPSNVPKPVLIILIPIEIIGMIVKPIALTLRLGANMTAGHIGMVAIFGLPFLLDSFGIGIVSISLNTAIFFLEIIVCLVQAYVFSLLSAVFIGMAIHAEH